MTFNGILLGIAALLVVVIIALAIVYFVMGSKEKQQIKEKEENDAYATTKVAKAYSVNSIFKFMEFEKIEDNMIVQKKGNKFLMVVECQGINYDLMSELEKTSVEKGFIQFLNTLRNSIQIYVQTRTINLDSSVQNYKLRLKKIETDLTTKEMELRKLIQNGSQNQKKINNLKFEITRLTNLYEYGKDIIANTERMSLNKNVLRKKYYIIISYYYSNIDSEGVKLEDYEIRELAFADLYAKAQSIIRTLSVTGVTGKILNSYQLVDLLYNAYNRDEAEKFGIEKAVESGFEEMYSTSPDYLDKRMKALDEEINEKALELAKESVLFAQTEKEKRMQEKEDNMEDLISELAKQLIVDNSQYMPDDITMDALENVEKKAKKRGRPKKKEVNQ